MAGSPVAPAAGQRRIAGQFASSAADAVTGFVREDAHAGLRLGLLPRGDVVAGDGEEPTGRGFIRGANQHANPLDLHLRVLSSGIICRHRCAHAVTSQHAGDQLRLGPTGNDRHRHRRAVHDRNSSAPGPAGRRSWQHGRTLADPWHPWKTSTGTSRQFRGRPNRRQHSAVGPFHSGTPVLKGEVSAELPAARCGGPAGRQTRTGRSWPPRWRRRGSAWGRG